MEIMSNVSQVLEKTPHLHVDEHLTQIISWWLPQIIEILLLILLLSTPIDHKQFTSIFDNVVTIFETNTIITIYLLTGCYMIQTSSALPLIIVNHFFFWL